MTKRIPNLQVALDHNRIEDALKDALAVGNEVDIIEAGTILLLKTEKEENAINDFFIFFDQTFKINEKKENIKTNTKIKKNKIEIEVKNSKAENNFSEEISIAQNFSDNLKSVKESEKIEKKDENFKEPNMEEIEEMENLGNVFNALNNHFKNTFKK